MKSVIYVCVLALLAIAPASAQTAETAQDVFWNQLRALCGQAFAGRIVEGTAASDAAFAGEPLVMHVRSCGENEIRIPFQVGADRSRTWVITRTPTALRLKHDHRHADGSEDAVTQYGGDSANAGSGTRQDFPADAFTARLIPAAATNIWTLVVEPGQLFAYALRRDAEGRRFRIEFDLTKPVETPPAPWGQP
jgi:hypothetical protein